LTSEPLRPSDDLLHRPAVDDPWWTETAWFGFSVPEAGLCGSIYQIYRTVQGVMATAVYVWSPGRESLHDLPYYRTFWHLPIPADAQPCDNELISGLSIRTDTPMSDYRLAYHDGDELRLELTWKGLIAAQPLAVSNGMGHLDQLGHVTGTMTLHGTTHPVDCVEMRDRSWTPRREHTTRTRRGYVYGATAGARSGFLLTTNVAPEGGDDDAVAGWTIEDHVVRPIERGRRQVRRDADHRPTEVLVTADVDGTTRNWHGTVQSRLALPTSPYFAWMSLTSWTDDHGTTSWGQDHDSWSPRRWRAFRRGEES
jgi:hypothetical protein